MKKLVISTLVLFQASIIFSCSCSGYINEFCYSADTSDNIALVELIEFDDSSAATFRLIENINNEIPDTISVLGQDGLNCNLSLNQFSIGDTLIINTRYYSNGFLNAFNMNLYNWGIEDCSRHYLTYSEEIVYGKLDTFIESEEIDYQLFKTTLFDCFDFTLSSRDISESSIDVYPNPTNGMLTISSTDIRITDVKIYDLNGRSLLFNMARFATGHRVNIMGDPIGILILELITPRGIIRRKVIRIIN